MEQFDVVVIGSLNLDLVAGVDRLPGPGETVSGDAYDEVPGGKGLNQAVAAARAGASVAIVGAVGDDAAGHRLRDVVRREGIDDRLLATVPDVPTGRALIAVDARAENAIVVVAGANGRVEVGPLPDARIVLVQLEIAPAAVLTGLEAARRNGALTILNPAPAERAAPELFRSCDVVVPNEHELALLGGADRLFGAGVSTLVVTRGAAGADLVTRDATTHVAPFDVSPVDTTGAGDAFCGGLAARLAAGDDIPDALRFAAATGALATTRHGAVPSLPHRAEIDALMAGVPVPNRDDADGSAGSDGSDAAAVARAYLAAFATGDPDAVAALVADDFVNEHTAALGSGCTGRDEYRRRLPGFLAAFAGLEYDVERLVVDGGTVAAAYRMRATSDGSPIDIRGVMVIDVVDGRVARRTDYWDALTFLRQTGQDTTG